MEVDITAMNQSYHFQLLHQEFLHFIWENGMHILWFVSGVKIFFGKKVCINLSEILIAVSEIGFSKNVGKAMFVLICGNKNVQG